MTYGLPTISRSKHQRDRTIIYENETEPRRDDESVVIPDGISDLEAFRRWTHSEDFPEAGRIWFLQGQVWVDMSKEQALDKMV
jgi:hypothetical protein